MTGMDNGHALVVGISRYRHINPLPTTVLKDARDIYAVLTEPALGGYRCDNVELLLDGEATQAGLRRAMASLAQRSDEESTVFLYISSHGGRIASGPHAGELLIPVDADYTSDETLSATAISGAEFTELFRAIRARKLVAVFDCCHAGGIGQPKAAVGPALKSGLPERYYEALQAGRGRVILASSRSTEVSYVLPGAANSLFTEHLLAGLRGGVVSEDGFVRILDLYAYVQPQVTVAERNQHPVFKAEIEDNFPIALRRGGQKSRVPKDDEGFRYDAYISYVDREPDASWVWDTLMPRLEAANLRVAVAGDVEQPGIARIVGVEQAIKQSRRTVLALSDDYLSDTMAHFQNVLGMTLGVQEGTYRVLPVKIAPFDESRLPVRLSQLVTPDLTHPRRGERELDRLVTALSEPLPHF